MNRIYESLGSHMSAGDQQAKEVPRPQDDSIAAYVMKGHQVSSADAQQIKRMAVILERVVTILHGPSPAAPENGKEATRPYGVGTAGLVSRLEDQHGEREQLLDKLERLLGTHRN